MRIAAQERGIAEALIEKDYRASIVTIRGARVDPSLKPTFHVLRLNPIAIPQHRLRALAIRAHHNVLFP